MLSIKVKFQTSSYVFIYKNVYPSQILPVVLWFIHEREKKSPVARERGERIQAFQVKLHFQIMGSQP